MEAPTEESFLQGISVCSEIYSEGVGIMKVLLVSNQRQNAMGVGNPIVYRMRDALAQDERIEEVVFMPFNNRLSSLLKIRSAAKKYDVVHIHFGGVYALTIWFALLGVRAKKLITFHGTDIHAKASKTANGWMERMKIRFNQKASFLCIANFDGFGFVAAEMMSYVPKYLYSRIRKKGFVQPLGVDYSAFLPMDKESAIKHLGLDRFKKYVLFSDVSNTSIKRKDIAESIVNCLDGNYSLLIMCGVKPLEVAYYINACEFLLLTSDEEGSPNIVREALALNKPVFSVPVGDVVKQLEDLRNSAIISRDPQMAADTILKVIVKPYTDNTRETLRDRLDFERVNKKVIDQYLKLTAKS